MPDRPHVTVVGLGPASESAPSLWDAVYELRDGSGIGVFAPQFGARRGFYVGLSKKL